jgi:hypothetical protein
MAEYFEQWGGRAFKLKALSQHSLGGAGIYRAESHDSILTSLIQHSCEQWKLIQYDVKHIFLLLFGNALHILSFQL